MRHDEPATMMHLIKPLLLLVGVLLLLVIAETAWGNSVRVHDVSGSDGPAITLSQVAELQGDYVEQFGGIVVGTFEPEQAKVKLETSAIVEAIRDEGARLGMIDFSGFGACVVHRTFTQPRKAAVKTSDAEPVAANFDARHGGAITIHTPTTVRSMIEHRVAKETGVGLASLDIVFNARDQKLLSQSAVAGRYEVRPASKVSLGKVTFRVQGYEGTRQMGEPTTINATVKQRVIAVIATDMIKRGDLVTRRNVRLSEITIDDVAQPYLQETDMVIGKVASMSIRPGQPLTSGRLGMPVEVKRRSTVEVVCKIGRVSVRFNGMALADGRQGDVIDIENTLTGERLAATVVGRGKVVAQSDQTDNKERDQ